MARISHIDLKLHKLNNSEIQFFTSVPDVMPYLK